MVAQVSINLIDYSEEMSSISLNAPDITPANLAAIETTVANFWTAIDPVVMGNQVSRNFPVRVAFTGAPPALAEAQREKKWMVHYRDSSPFLDSPADTVPNPAFGRKFHFTIPTADFAAGNVLAGTDFCDLTINPWLAIIGVFQLSFKSPYGGAPIVTKVQVVGANT